MCHLEEQGEKHQNYSINFTFPIKREEYRADSPQMSSLTSAYTAVSHLKPLTKFLSISSFFIRAILYYLGLCTEQQTTKAKKQSKGQVAERLMRKEVTHLAFHPDQISTFNLDVGIWRLLTLLMADRGKVDGGENAVPLGGSRAEKICCQFFCITTLANRK